MSRADGGIVRRLLRTTESRNIRGRIRGEARSLSLTLIAAGLDDDPRTA